MDKGRRQEIQKLKFKKRIKNYKFTKDDLNNPKINTNCLRNTGKPCSCDVCSPYKYRKDNRNKDKINLRKELILEYSSTGGATL